MMKRTGFVLLVSLSGITVATQSVAATTLSELLNAAQNDTQDQAPAERIAQRIANASAELVGKDYARSPIDPLGEGEWGIYDQDPLFRLDRFDCTTFVETTLAAAISDSTTDFIRQMNRIRYLGSRIGFTTRNHFPSLDWIPNNQWLLSDITRQVSGKVTQVAETQIDKKAWYAAIKMNRVQTTVGAAEKEALLKRLHKEGEDLKPQTARLDYAPFSFLFTEDDSEGSPGYRVNQAAFDQIPSGAVINVVRPNWNLEAWIGTRMNVSHQGFAIRKDGKLFFRHASSSEGRIVDTDLVSYLAQYRSSSTAKGINILQPRTEISPLP